jgi:hypothetical protein
MQLWDELLPQVQDTLSLLRTSRVNKRLSAYAVLEGPFNYNKTLIAPPGTKAVIYNDPSNRTSWGRHGNDAYYLNRAPEHCKMPAVDPDDTIRMAAQDLIIALQNSTRRRPSTQNHVITKLFAIYPTFSTKV